MDTTIEKLIQESWIPGWHTANGLLVQSCFHPSGSYEDPWYGVVEYAGIPKMIARLARLVPNLSFEVMGAPIHGTADPAGMTRCSLQWMMRGLLPVLKRPIALPGCDFLDIKAGRIVKARTYFDRLGLGMAALRRRP